MSVGPEALRRFGPLLFLACPTGVPGCCACPTGVPGCCACPTGVPGAGEPGRPRDLASSLRSAPRLEARPGPPGPPAPSTPVGLWWLTLLGASSRSPARPRRRPRALQPGPRIPPAPSTPVVFVLSVRIPSRPRRRPPAPQQTHQFLPRPPHRWCLSFLCVSHPGPAAAHQHHSRPTNSCRALHTSRAVVADVDRRVVSKPIQAPPPPTGTAARPTNSSGTLHTSRAVVADVARRVVSKPGQAPPPPTSTTAGPSDCSVLSTPVAVGFYRIRSRLPTCRSSNDAKFPFGGAEATT